MLIIRQLRINIQCTCAYATQKQQRMRPRSSKLNKNPGIQRQLQLFSEENLDVENSNPEDINLDEIEADFMKSREIVDDCDRSFAKAMEKHELRSIEQKYFKSSPAPNMLTWAEKEQIRYLHNENPNHWTPEKLATSFPAVPDVIRKILKASWKPQNAERIIEHDKNVSKNWNDFAEGKLQIDSLEVKEHLSKFTSRRNNLSSFSEKDLKRITESSIPKPRSNEFSSIISSYKQLTAAPEKSSSVSIDYTKDSSRLLESNAEIKQNNKKDKTLYSLESFKEKVKEEVNSSEILSNENRLLLSEKKRNLAVNTYVPSSERFDCDAVVTPQGKLGQIAHFSEENYPLRIFIPKNKRKHGALYKVNDCYYTSDGMFLYRVPGLV